MSKKIVTRAYFGLYNPARKGLTIDTDNNNTGSQPAVDNKAVENVTKQAAENKATSAANKALAEANQAAVAKVAADLAAKQAQDVITFLSKVEAAAQYQPKGEYITDAKVAEKITEAQGKADQAADAKFATKAELETATGGVSTQDLKTLKDAIDLLKDNPDSIAEIAKKADKDKVYDKNAIDKLIKKLNDKDTDLEKAIAKAATADDVVKAAELTEKVKAIIDLTPYVKAAEVEATYAKKSDLADKADKAAIETELAKKANASDLTPLATKEEVSAKADATALATKADQTALDNLKAEADANKAAVAAEVAARKSADTLNDAKVQGIADDVSKIKIDAAQAKVENEKALSRKADQEAVNTALAEKATKAEVAEAKQAAADAVKEAAKANTALADKADATALEPLATKEALKGAKDELAQAIEAAKTVAEEAKAEAKTGEAVIEAKEKATAADAKAKEVEAALVNYVTKAVADETYQPKGEYATKAEVQAIGSLDPTTLQSLKDLAQQLAGQADLTTVLDKLNKVFTKDEVNEALAKKADVASLEEYAEKNDVTSKLKDKADKVQVAEDIEAAKAVADAAVREVNTTAQQAKAKATENAAGLEEAKTKVEKAIEDLGKLTTKVNDLALNGGAGTGASLDAQAVADKVQEIVDAIVAREKFVGETKLNEKLADKADVSALTAVQAKADKNASDLLSKADVSALADKADKTVFEAKATELDTKLNTLETATVPNLIDTKLTAKLAGYQEKGEYVTKEAADRDYQPKGEYATAAALEEVKTKANANEALINGLDKDTLVHTADLDTYAKAAKVTEDISAAVAGLGDVYVSKNDADVYAKKADITTEIGAKATELKKYADDTFATKQQLDNATIAAGGSGLTQTQVEGIVDNKLGALKDAVQTIANIQSGVNDNKSSVESILAELAKKATKDEVAGKVATTDFEDAKQTLNTAITAQENALAAAKTALEKAINDKSEEAAAAYQTKVDFAAWTRDVYGTEIARIKDDMMTADETDTAIDAKLATNLETLKGIFQVKGNYLTREDLTNTLKDGYITKNESDRLYQGVGNYATIEYVDDQIGKNKVKIDEVNTAIANKLDVSAATSLYQTKGDYVLRSELDTLATTPTFANAINTAIVGKGYLDKETADGYYAPKGQYVTTENIEDAIATSAAVTAKQDALTFGNGLSYDADTKTLTATGTGASVDLTPYAKKAESDAKYGPKDTLTEDQKGVVESILRDKNYATNADLGSYSASMDTNIGQLRASINTLKDTTVPAIDTRVTALEGKAAPTDFTEDQKTKLDEILTGKGYASHEDIDNAKAELKGELVTEEAAQALVNGAVTTAEGKVNEAKEALEGKITELKNTVDGIHAPDLSAYETQAQAEAKYLKLEDIETKLKEKGFITQADLQPILDAIKALKGE
jgi:merozoite surface protein 3 (MSP3), putative